MSSRIDTANRMRSPGRAPRPPLPAPPDTQAAQAAEPEGEATPARASTPPDSTPVPVPNPEGVYDLSRPEFYLNRELTWLNFNDRVLHEAEDERTPLLERVKFAAIAASNIDEFFMKRIGGLKQQVGAGFSDRTVDGRTPDEQIVECYAVIRDMEQRQRNVVRLLQQRLAEQHIVIATCADLSNEDQAWLRDHYFQNIFPLVTPQATDPAHPFPFISNLSLNLLVSVRYPSETTGSVARVKVPVGAGTPRFIQLQDRPLYVRLEDLMAHNLDLLFPGMEIDSCEFFRVTRNANTDIEESQADDLLAFIETGLRVRRFAPIVRLEVESDMSPLHRGRLAAELGLDEQSDVFEADGMMAMRDLMELTAIRDASLRHAPLQPVDHPVFRNDDNIFHLIREHGPILVHHPYESFTTSVERFLHEASEDPKVRAIKMTLYRTSDDSKAIDYLIDAARNGKQVAVVLELKARFEEEANIRWANRLEERGVHVTYGVVGLKTHAKAILVVRQDYTGLRRYAHVGTGNYHAGTARQYTDFGLFTCEDAIGHDLTELFNYLTTGYKPKRDYKRILPAPKILKQSLLEKIDREIAAHSKDKPGLLQFKVNALEDADVTAALYRAAQAGVHVDLIVRDTCRLRPGIPGLSENVRVISIVGRFLEHSRVYYFQNGDAPEYYIGSADVMKRNLESRVEVLAPVDTPELREQLRYVIDTCLADNRNAWEMQPDGSYVQRETPEGGPEVQAQVLLAEWSERRLREATRLRRRKPRVIRLRNVR
jgi:polyphosphate kinase